MGNGLKLYLSTLSGNQNFRIAYMIGPDILIRNFHRSNCSAATATQVHNNLVGLFDTIQDRLSKCWRLAAIRNNILAHLAYSN